MKFVFPFAAALLLAAPALAQAQAVGVGVGIAGSASQAQSQSGSASQSRSSLNSRNAASVSISSPADVTSRQRISGTQRLIAAPAVFAPGLAAASIETCLGSASGGVSFPGGGVAFGTTTPDRGCAARLDARTLFAFGLKAAAVARLCYTPEIAAVLPQCAPPPSASAGGVITGSIAPTAYTASDAEPRRGCVHYELLRGCLD